MELLELEELGEKERMASLAEEKEAEKQEKKRRKKNEKKKSSKQKKDSEDKDEPLDEEDATEKVEEPKVEPRRPGKRIPDSSMVVAEAMALYSGGGPMVLHDRLKPKPPPFDPVEIFKNQTAESIGVAPIQLTNVPSYITLNDMEDVELYPDKKNSNPGCFIYKVSIANGGKKHPFRDIYEYAARKREELDVMVEVSPITCGRNMEDVLCLAGKPGRVSYSCKLRVRELITAVGRYIDCLCSTLEWNLGSIIYNALSLATSYKCYIF